MSRIHTAQLRTVYAFTCEECGRDSMVEPIIVELSSEDEAFLRSEHGVEGQTGDFIRMPETARCMHCGASFAVESENE